MSCGSPDPGNTAPNSQNPESPPDLGNTAPNTGRVPLYIKTKQINIIKYGGNK